MIRTQVPRVDSALHEILILGFAHLYLGPLTSVVDLPSRRALQSAVTAVTAIVSAV